MDVSQIQWKTTVLGVMETGIKIQSASFVYIFGRVAFNL
jgi:hypothetical protein